jgi:resuscitation-promoting factor RpfC
MIGTSIAASALPKAALAITLSLHPAAAHHTQYTVKSGDTLASVAKHEYGSADRWPALWWVNRGKVKNPNMIAVGQRLELSAWHPGFGWLTRAAMGAIPAPPAAPAPVAEPVATGTGSAPVAAPAAPAPSSYSAASGSFQQCVIQAESGGNASAVNASSGAGGLYGFLPSTWQALGHSGLPENASVSEQNQAFQQEYAQSGSSAWSAYDGC